MIELQPAVHPRPQRRATDRPTEYGEGIARAARSTTVALDQVRREIELLRNLDSGKVIEGSDPRMADIILAPALARPLRKFQKLRFRLRTQGWDPFSQSAIIVVGKTAAAHCFRCITRISSEARKPASGALSNRPHRGPCPSLYLTRGHRRGTGTEMNLIRELRDMGQSLWLDNITREMLDDGHLGRLIEDLSISGLTSNPSIFNQAMGASTAYDGAIRDKARAGKSGEALFTELALEDLCRAADLFRPIHILTDHLDGWVSMEVSPRLARDTAATIAAASGICAYANRPNLFVKIPGTPEGLQAIEDSIFAGVPINVTLLFSREHYLDAAGAYLRGLERRLKAGLDLRVASVASLFVSRWDAAVNESGLERDLRNHLGIAIAQRTYRAYRELLASSRWQMLARAGALPQRLLWASTGTKDPQVSESLYVEALAAPDTINTLPEKTLQAFACTGQLHGPMAVDGGTAEEVLTRYAQAGVDVDALALRLQQDGVRAFEKSWDELLSRIAGKCVARVR